MFYCLYSGTLCSPMWKERRPSGPYYAESTTPLQEQRSDLLIILSRVGVVQHNEAMPYALASSIYRDISTWCWQLHQRESKARTRLFCTAYLCWLQNPSTKITKTSTRVYYIFVHYVPLRTNKNSTTHALQKIQPAGSQTPSAAFAPTCTIIL